MFYDEIEEVLLLFVKIHTYCIAWIDLHMQVIFAGYYFVLLYQV